MGGAITAIPGIIFGRAVYYREKPAFLRPFAYFVAQVLAEIPLVLVSVFVFGTIVYMMCLTILQICHIVILVHVICSLLVFILLQHLHVLHMQWLLQVVLKQLKFANTIVGVSSSMFSLFAGFIIP